MTGYRLTSSIPPMMRSLSSCFDATRMWRRTERANLEKKPSMRLSQEPCFGGEGEREAARRLSSEPSLVCTHDRARMSRRCQAPATNPAMWCDRLDARLLVVGDDRYRLAQFFGPLRLGRGLFQHLDLAIDAQNLCHLLLELGIAAFQDNNAPYAV
jgi:hypothetical protein